VFLLSVAQLVTSLAATAYDREYFGRFTSDTKFYVISLCSDISSF
jgi:hypothetical protein